MRRFFVPTSQIHHSLAVISGNEFHHLRRVLRLRIGDEVTICDDHGQEHYGTVVTLSPTWAEVTIRHTQLVQTSRVPLTLGLGMLKGQKMDLVIEKVTELGVDRVAPFISTFTVSQLPTERQSERIARWQRIAQSAAKQSGSSVPQILAPQTFVQLCDSQSPDVTTIRRWSSKATPPGIPSIIGLSGSVPLSKMNETPDCFCRFSNWMAGEVAAGDPRELAVSASATPRAKALCRKILLPRFLIEPVPLPEHEPASAA